MSIRSSFVALALGALLCGTGANAAPIDDPRIPIDAVNTPGDAESLFHITEPGSYYLPGNLLGVAGKSGIRISASNVHIDLMGYTVRGSGSALDAIFVSGIRTRIRIHNGIISGWPRTGIYAFVSSYVRVQDLDISSVEGAIGLGASGVVERCSIVSGGDFGIRVGARSWVSNCSVAETQFEGITVGSASTVQGCTINSGGGIGVLLGIGSSIHASTVTSSQTGIIAHQMARVTDCYVGQNQQRGIFIASGSIRGSTIHGNGDHGIESDGSVHVLGNTVSSNSGDGIRVQGGSRVEDNDIRSQVTGCGVRAFGTGSYIVKNTLTGNLLPVQAPNFGNFVGTLVHVNGVNGRNDPWANIHSN